MYVHQIMNTAATVPSANYYDFDVNIHTYLHVCMYLSTSVHMYVHDTA